MTVPSPTTGHLRASTPSTDALRLETGSGVGPTGRLENPRFFEGFLEHPAAAARGPLAVAAVARARCSTAGQPGSRDAVVTADGLDGEVLRRGTTNVDVNPALQRALALVGNGDRSHVAVGSRDLRVTTPDASLVEAEVALPARALVAEGAVHERELVVGS